MGEQGKKISLEVVEWEGRVHCVYLNDHRIAGGKPWGGGRVCATFATLEKDLAAAVPSLGVRPSREAAIKEMAEALGGLVSKHKQMNPMRTGDFHSNCDCLRCKFDAAEAALSTYRKAEEGE